MISKPGRNDSCPCGSGKKYKKCCATNEQSPAASMQPVFSNASIPNALQTAVQHHNAGRWVEAEAVYRQILRVQPKHPDALHLLALVMNQRGEQGIAVELVNKALKSSPGEPNYLNSLGAMLNEQGKQGEAIANLRKAISAKPDYVAAYQNLGNALFAQGKAAEAIASYKKGLALNPNSPELYCLLGNVFKKQAQFEDALTCYRQALTLNPRSAEAYNDMGNAFSDQGKLAEAMTCFQNAIALKPDLAAAHSNLGNAFKEQGKLAEAIICFQTAISLKPNLAELYSNLGNTLKDAGRLTEGVACLQKALALKPDYADAHYNLGNALKEQGRLAEAVDSYRKALMLQPMLDQAYGNLFFILNYTATCSPDVAVAEARRYGDLVRRKAGEPYSAWQCAPQSQRLRIGLVSGDLRSHPVGYFLQGLLEQYDRSRLEIVAYPTHTQTDEFTDRLRPAFSEWVPLYGKNDKAAAQQIHDDGIHILIDLSGYTNHNRLPVFCHRPAPVQATWLGYFGTTGVAEIDYLIGDPHTTPPGEESHFVEKIWRLPETYLCFTPPDVDVGVSALPAQANGHITFGCFNNLTKIGDAVVALWAQVLHAVPGSRLFLKTRQLSEEVLRANTLARFAACGIGSERLILEGHSPRAELLAAYHRVDIALDPFPYPGGTTSAESLWMGVPVLTKHGDRFLSHVGETVAHNAGLANWIACDDIDYVAKAIAYAADVQSLAQLRAGLRQQVLASPLYDAARFARHFEAAMWEMWHNFQSRQGNAS